MREFREASDSKRGKNASRNVIDVTDVAATVSHLIEQASEQAPEPASPRAATFNVANPNSVSVADIVAAIAEAVGKPAVVQWKDAGSPYPIDVAAVLPVYRTLGIPFGDAYLLNVVKKYYG